MLLRDEDVGAATIQCDHCTNLHDDYNIDQFQLMIDEAKEAGWRIERDERVEGGWSHTCPDCRRGGRLKAQRALLGL